MTSRYERSSLAAQANLVRGTVKAYRFIQDLCGDACGALYTCGLEKSALPDMFYELFDNTANQNPLDNWPEYHWENLSEGEHLCNHCLDQARATHSNFLRGFWDKLPSLFSLPPWSDLQAIKDATSVSLSPFSCRMSIADPIPDRKLTRLKSIRM